MPRGINPSAWRGDTVGYRRERLDISAAQRDLGWAPRRTLQRGIADYAVWLRAQR